MLELRAPIPSDLRSDVAHCRAMIRTGSRSFFMASQLLPSSFQDAVYALYAFCREADDAIDDGPDPHEGLAIFERRLAAVYSGTPDNAVDRVLARVVENYGLPRELLEALLQGFAWDAGARSYKDLGSVYGYSVRVAGSVGIMMAILMGVRDAHLLARAADLGVAMQLTNIARDVGEDARNGRVYLPSRWLREVGLSPAQLVRNPEFTPALGQVVQRLLSAAECLYCRADSGIAGLPRRFRPGIYAARRLYAGIGHELLRRGSDSVSRRTVLSFSAKALLTLKAIGPIRHNPALRPVEPLPQVRYLLRAVDAISDKDWVSPGSLDETGDIEWILGLIGKLEHRDREANPVSSGVSSGVAS